MPSFYILGVGGEGQGKEARELRPACGWRLRGGGRAARAQGRAHGPALPPRRGQPWDQPPGPCRRARASPGTSPRRALPLGRGRAPPRLAGRGGAARGLGAPAPGAVTSGPRRQGQFGKGYRCSSPTCHGSRGAGSAGSGTDSPGAKMHTLCKGSHPTPNTLSAITRPKPAACNLMF